MDSRSRFSKPLGGLGVLSLPKRLKVRACRGRAYGQQTYSIPGEARGAEGLQFNVGCWMFSPEILPGLSRRIGL